jgi:hypothetical protein
MRQAAKETMTRNLVRKNPRSNVSERIWSGFSSHQRNASSESAIPAVHARSVVAIAPCPRIGGSVVNKAIEYAAVSGPYCHHAQTAREAQAKARKIRLPARAALRLRK